ncbi:MAG: hypothetical protein GXO64_03670 [Candidatus Micrarchaeota archaeon]|nr:hypothetical protein [Candidatus Micrarchaeota archaeon]
MGKNHNEINKKTVFIGIILVLLYLTIAFDALPKTGLTWDETRHLSGGKARAYSIYAAATGKPQLAMCDLVNPPMDKDTRDRCWSGRPRLSQTVSGFTWAFIWFVNGGKLDFWESIAAHRMGTLLFVSLCIFFLFLFATEAFGLKVGIFSALSLIFIPRFFVHSLYVALDAPAASMVFISVYFFWKGMKSRKWALMGGAVFGLALATKVNAYFVPMIIFAWFIAGFRNEILQFLKNMKKQNPQFWPKNILKSVPLPVYTFIIISPVVFFLSWPWLWFDTLTRYAELLHTKETIRVVTYYMGVSWDNIVNLLPWHYTWVMIGMTVPVTILAFALIGLHKPLRDIINPRNKDSILVLMGAVVPLFVFSSPIATLHDGVRIFLNVFPFIAILSGLGAERIFNILNKAFERFKKNQIKSISHFTNKKNLKFNLTMMSAFIIVCLLIASPFIVAYSRGMPYMATYYNALIGGPEGAYEHGFDMDYWGESYLEAAKWLNENAENGSIVYVPWATNIMEMYKYGDIGMIGERFREGRHHLGGTVDSIGAIMFEQKGILRDDITITNSSQSADYVVLLGRRNLVERKKDDGSFFFPEERSYIDNCVPVYTVNIDEAPLVIIFRADCKNKAN